MQVSEIGPLGGLPWHVPVVCRTEAPRIITPGNSVWKRGLLGKESYQKSPLSRDFREVREFRDSRDFREPPDCGK